MIHCHLLHPHLAQHFLLFSHYMMSKELDSNKEIKVDETYDYLPQEYELTDHDLCAHIAIESSLSKELLVQIDGSSVRQNQLMCLLDKNEWVNDDVIYAYICCLKDQIHVQNDNKVYFESPFVTSLLKRDGNLGIQEDSSFMTKIVKKYMEHDMGPPEGPWRHQPLISPDPAACTPNPPEMDPSRPDPAGSDRAPPSSSLEHRHARPTASALSVPARVCTRTTLVPLACSNRMGRRPSRPGIKPRPSPSHIFCRSIIAHLEISPDATTIFRCELCQHQPQSWNKECAFALMKQLSHSPLLLPTTTILHRYFSLLDNYWR
ncbi:uncharacterized protein [Triticum aestivum]|uniref:uncharacterized protein isoform X2 n=1 Tax=Triticum aestivum TaxID=4565 RepID=UPI001D00ED7B|nr:uncharacterized protein LOC123070267 isoform X2 [Triticum aestivum]